ncbi:nucleoside-diphosphate sugar epimerase/dehydratase [Desulfobacterales bacterium HSG16]|nr:nucleoside-diphosphate sugar epimerase/dehydratase [Desulfobacterales bacterium HSG16]
MAIDVLLFSMAHIGAYMIRFEFLPSSFRVAQMVSLLPFIVFLKLFIFYAFGLYRGMFRYAGLNDMWRIIKATVLSSLLISSAILFIHRFHGYSRAVFILDACLTLMFTGGLRLGIRVLYQNFISGEMNWKMYFFSVTKKTGKPVVIIGAGNAGEKTLREVADNLRLDYRIVGFIDDDTEKRGQSIHGVQVLGDVSDLTGIVKNFDVEEALIAMPSATGLQMRKIIEACEDCRIKYKTLPGFGELIDGKVSVKALRDVNYEDLLGRQPVKLDEEKIREYLNERTILVSGAGGSIGSELCRQIVKFNPGMLILLDSSESNLYSIQMELKHSVGWLKYITVLENVQNDSVIESVFKRYKPQVVFHAAAYKHVPMLERNPWQAVFNNIMGTRVMMEHSVHYKVDHFVLVSTDKAVRPTNVMGASKRVCEMILQSYLGNHTRMMSVRFGNVVGSSGSVIPLFRQQIARGGPVTVTHPEVTRYFMTISEASRLILQAGALGEGGEIFILEMGTSVKIADMAHDLIRLSGKEPGKDIEIVYTGLRSGEKLYEELITEGEGIVSTEHEKILVLKPNWDWNGHHDIDGYRKWIMLGLEDLYNVAQKHEECDIKAKLRTLVPEYEPQDTECIL